MLKIINQDLFLYKLFVYDCSLESILREQYELSKKGISFTISANIPIFEKDALVNLVLMDKKNDVDDIKADLNIPT